MTLEDAKVWGCSECTALEVQRGPRALELLPTPPVGWSVVDTTISLPARVVDGVKMGETRSVDRKVFCPKHSNDSVRAQLRKAQEVINKHVADQIEGLHCVDCVAIPDEACNCPMVVQIFEAMKGFEVKT